MVSYFTYFAEIFEVLEKYLYARKYWNEWKHSGREKTFSISRKVENKDEDNNNNNNNNSSSKVAEITQRKNLNKYFIWNLIYSKKT